MQLFFRKEKPSEPERPTLAERLQEAAREVERCTSKIEEIGRRRFAFIRKHSIKTNRQQVVLSAVVKNIGEMEPLLKEWAAMNEELAQAIRASRAAQSVWCGLKLELERQEKGETVWQ